MLILFEVQANDIVMSTFLHRSSLPLGFPHPSQLDKTGGIFYKCIERDIRSCKQQTHPEFSNIGLYGCIQKNGAT